MDYENLGTLITQGVLHHLEYRPREAIAKLKAGTLFKEMLETAKQAQTQLYATAAKEDRAFMWSDLKWQTGLFPPEEPNTSEKATREAHRCLSEAGSMWRLKDRVLKEANLSENWNPSNPESWEEWMAGQPQ